MILAELSPTELAPWINLGALGILGYHLLWGLPKMVKEFSETILTVARMHTDNSAKDREEFTRRSDKLVDAMMRSCRWAGSNHADDHKKE